MCVEIFLLNIFVKNHLLTVRVILGFEGHKLTELVVGDQFGNLLTRQ